MTDTPTVYVVQQPSRYDRVTRKFVPIFDLTPAAAYGPLVLLIGPGNIFPEYVDKAASLIEQALSHFTERDYILPLGDPVAIAAAVLAAGKRTGGRVNFLKRSRAFNSYEVVTVSAGAYTGGPTP